MAITRIVSEKYDMVEGKYTKIADAYPETIAHGAVLKTGTRSVQIMSDIWGSEKYAVYWDAEKGKPVDVWLDTCDYGWLHGDKVHAEVDATDQVRGAYVTYLMERELERLVGSAKNEAQRVVKGCTAKVTRGKTAKGTEGKVIAVIKARYGIGYYSSVEDKLGIATSDVTYKKALPNGKVVDAHQDVVWVWARNCVRTDVPEIDIEPLRQSAAQRALRDAA